MMHKKKKKKIPNLGSEFDKRKVLVCLLICKSIGLYSEKQICKCYYFECPQKRICSDQIGRFCRLIPAWRHLWGFLPYLQSNKL